MRRLKLPHNKNARILLGLVASLGSLLLIVLLSDEPVLNAAPAPNAEPMAGVVIDAPVPEAKPDTSQAKLILELFNPSDAALGEQITRTSLIQQIEQAMTVSYVLTKCQLISQDDYTDTFRALVIYTEKMKLAPDAAGAEAVVRHIAESAGASYALVYSRTSCRSPELQPLATELARWTKSIMAQTP